VVNSFFNSRYQYFYGGDAYYELQTILATEDGGCILAGTYFDYNQPIYQRDLYIIKVNSDGLLVGIDEQTAQDVVPVNVYPNPGSSYFNVPLGTNRSDLTLQLFDAQGRRLQDTRLNSNVTTKNTGQYPGGLYFYQILSEGNVVYNGKWVKEF